MVLVGLAFGIYIGLWFCAIGGIVQAVDGIKADPVDSLDIAVGAVRLPVAAPAGWVAFFVLAIPGSTLLHDKPKRRR